MRLLPYMLYVCLSCQEPNINAHWILNSLQQFFLSYKIFLNNFRLRRHVNCNSIFGYRMVIDRLKISYTLSDNRNLKTKILKKRNIFNKSEFFYSILLIDITLILLTRTGFMRLFTPERQTQGRQRALSRGWWVHVLSFEDHKSILEETREQRNETKQVA